MSTPISFEWPEPERAFIYRGGHAWARLERSAADNGTPCWAVTPLLQTSNGGLEEGQRVEFHEDGDRESAALFALRIVTAPDFRAPPAFATDPAIWEHVKAKNPRPYDEWEPKDFASAKVIYGHCVRKYGLGNPELAARYGVVLA